MDTKNDRRAFLRGLVRWPALAALGATGVYLGARGGGPLQAAQSCRSAGLCRNCPARSSCGLPQARLSRGAEGMTPGRPRF